MWVSLIVIAYLQEKGRRPMVNNGFDTFFILQLSSFVG
jgi:hypothetical protein